MVFFETYKMDDAEIAVLGLGSTMGTARIAVDNLRADGIKAGLINLRLFRPFPAGQLIRALNGVKVLGVFDRADTFSLNGGPLFLDVKASLYDSSRDLKVVNYIYGLGGRDINVSNIEDILRELVAIKEGQKEKKVTYYGVRE